MPNWMSDEDLGLESGDLRCCEHCGKVYSVDEWHSCVEGNAHSREEAESFNREYFGKGQRKLVLQIEIHCPNTAMALTDVLNDMASNFEPGRTTQSIDHLLKRSWQVQTLLDQQE